MESVALAIGKVVPNWCGKLSSFYELLKFGNRTAQIACTCAITAQRIVQNRRCIGQNCYIGGVKSRLSVAIFSITTQTGKDREDGQC